MIILLKFLKEIEAPYGKIISLAIVSGFANGFLLALINIGAENISSQSLEERIFVMYLISLVLYIYTLKYAASQAATIFEKGIRQVRVRLANKIRRAEVQFIEKMGHGDLFAKLTEGDDAISLSALLFATTCQSSIVLLFGFFYVAWLSFLSFVVLFVTLGMAVLWYLALEKHIHTELQNATVKRTEFFNMLTQMLDGFKEVKINQRKSDALFREINAIANQYEQLKVRVSIKNVLAMMVGQITLFLLLGLMVFILPSFNFFIQSEIVFKMVAASFFIMAPVGMIVTGLPSLALTNVALGNIYQLETELDAVISEQSQLPVMPLDDFHELRLSAIAFHYLDPTGKPLFSVGPFNLTIPRGELLFMVGGNGSGKSTFLKLLTGLYYPNSGSIYVDEEEIEHIEYQSYRELFAIVFTDFHLFDKFYGLSEIDRKSVRDWLRQMELEHKTKYLDGKFSHLDLSTGQKKRLAFIIAMLEDKLIYVFDELAADQDPQFRKKFYEIILPDLKNQGKTVIVVTHDDKYFPVADRVLKMEYGQLVELTEI